MITDSPVLTHWVHLRCSWACHPRAWWWLQIARIERRNTCVYPLATPDIIFWGQRRVEWAYEACWWRGSELWGSENALGGARGRLYPIYSVLRVGWCWLNVQGPDPRVEQSGPLTAAYSSSGIEPSLVQGHRNCGVTSFLEHSSIQYVRSEHVSTVVVNQGTMFQCRPWRYDDPIDSDNAHAKVQRRCSCISHTFAKSMPRCNTPFIIEHPRTCLALSVTIMEWLAENGDKLVEASRSDSVLRLKLKCSNEAGQRSEDVSRKPPTYVTVTS